MDRHVTLLFVISRLLIVNSVEDDLGFTAKTGAISMGEGATGQLKCSVSNMTEYTISWYRETRNGDRTIIYRDGMLILNNLGREQEAYSNHSTYDVQIRQVCGRDLGYLLNGNNYTCEVSLKSTGEVVRISSGVIILAKYTPSLIYPICESRDFSTDFIGSNIKMSCYSEPGNPISTGLGESVKLQWLKNNKTIQDVVQQDTTTFTYLNYTFTLTVDDLNSTFMCNNGINSCKLTTDPQTSSLDLIFVIGVSIGGVVFLALCILIGVCTCKKRDSTTTSGTSAGQQQVQLDPIEPVKNSVDPSLEDSGTVDNFIYDDYHADDKQNPHGGGNLYNHYTSIKQ